jgi:competence protein ComEC
MFLALLAFAAGIALGHYTWRPPLWWFVAALAYATAAAWFLSTRPRSSVALTLAAFAFAGAFAIELRLNGDGAAVFDSGEQVMVTAHVTAEGRLQSEGVDHWRQQIVLETESIGSESETRATRFGLRLTVYSKSAEPDGSADGGADSSHAAPVSSMRLFHYGERLRFTANLFSPRNFHNPGAFDYAEYLREQGIQATTSAKFSEIENLPGFSGSKFALWRARAHRSIVEHIHQLWPERIAELIDVMVIGERTFIERPERVDFQRSGTYHMIVVAGLHVGILAAFALWILRLLGFNDVAASACVMVLIFAYAVLTGEGAPVWRAALMFAVYPATRLLYRARAMLNALAIAALCLLIADPSALFTASFQMTVACVGLIAGIAALLLDQTIDPYARGLRNLDALAYDRSLPPKVAQFRIDLRLISVGFSRFMPRRISRILLVGTFRVLFSTAGLITISAVMQLGLTLPMAYYFHRATAVAIPANLLMVPLLQLLMPAAVLAIGLSYVSFVAGENSSCRRRILIVRRLPNSTLARRNEHRRCARAHARPGNLNGVWHSHSYRNPYDST